MLCHVLRQHKQDLTVDLDPVKGSLLECLPHLMTQPTVEVLKARVKLHLGVGSAICLQIL